MLPACNVVEYTLLFQKGLMETVWGNTGPKQDRNPAGTIPNPAALCLSKGMNGSTLWDLLLEAYFSLLGWFHPSCSAALLHRRLMTLVYPKSWDLQNNLGFIFSASHNSLPRNPVRGSPARSLASIAYLSSRRRVHNFFTTVSLRF